MIRFVGLLMFSVGFVVCLSAIKGGADWIPIVWGWNAAFGFHLIFGDRS